MFFVNYILYKRCLFERKVFDNLIKKNYFRSFIVWFLEYLVEFEMIVCLLVFIYLLCVFRYSSVFFREKGFVDRLIYR